MVVVSAPGKILLAGGYLVLEEGNSGLVVAVNRRFYCQCDVVNGPPQLRHADDTDKDDEEATTTTTTPTNATIITVQSPQFDTEWKYSWNGTTIQSNANNTSPNAFIEKTLRVVLLYLSAEGVSLLPSKMIHLKLAADNDFYSLVPHLQQRQLDLCNGEKLPRCLPAAKRNTTKNQDTTSTTTNTTTVLKTGLGSSACLVTAIVAAMIQTLLLQHTKNDHATATTTTTIPHLHLICALAQLSHCYAQGKVGSGFDVSAACYGSHVYQRFSPTLLKAVLAELDNDRGADTTGAGQNALIQSVVNDTTNNLGNGVLRPVHSFRNRDNQASSSFLQVMMADVSMGSESPSMASSVLAWKTSVQTTNVARIPFWDDLACFNGQIIDLLSQLDDVVQERPGDCDTSKFASLAATEWSSLESQQPPTLVRILLKLQSAFMSVRHHLKALGQHAGVPIEPNVQTALCDATSQLPGVLATLVPGAGGYDAVACIYINDTTVRNAVAQFWAHEWKNPDQNGVGGGVVCALTVAGVDFGQGLLVEDQFPIIATNDDL